MVLVKKKTEKQWKNKKSTETHFKNSFKLKKQLNKCNNIFYAKIKYVKYIYAMKYTRQLNSNYSFLIIFFFKLILCHVILH